MSELQAIPQNWQWVTLQDVAEVVTGNTPPTSNAGNYGGEIPFFKPPQLNDLPVGEAPETLSEKGIEKARLLPPKSVLVSCIGILGKTAITKTTSATNQQINALVFEPPVQPEYGFYYTQTLSSWLKEHSSATTVAIINKGKFEVTPFPLPPAAEQTRIVAKLEELLTDLDAGVAELKAAKKKLAQYRQSLLKAAVEGALTAEWRTKNLATETGAQLLERILTERRARWEAKQLAKFKEQGKPPPKDWQKKYPEPVQPDATGLPELPEGWVWACLDALIVDGPQNGLYLPGDRYGFGTPILRIDDYQIGWHRSKASLNLVNADDALCKTYSLVIGDLVINRVNSMTHLGKSLLVTKSLDGVLFESNMMRSSLSALSSGEFVAFYLGSDVGRMRLTRDAKWAVNQASINQQDVRRTPVPVAPAAEQKVIASLLKEQLDAADRQRVAIEQSLKQSTAQRQNILRAAFSGQLVPQDPNDEPASVLLARIRAERTQREADKKPRGRKPQEAA